MTRSANSAAERRRNRVALRGVGFVLAVALGGVAVWLILVSTTQKSLEIGVLAGLWGILLGAFSVFGSRGARADGAANQPQIDPTGAAAGLPPGQTSGELYGFARVPGELERAPSGRAELNLREIGEIERAAVAAARREFQAELQEMLRREVALGVAKEVAGLRSEVTALRNELVEKVGGQLRLEHIETTRIIGSDLEALQHEMQQLRRASGITAPPADGFARPADVATTASEPLEVHDAEIVDDEPDGAPSADAQDVAPVSTGSSAADEAEDSTPIGATVDAAEVAWDDEPIGPAPSESAPSEPAPSESEAVAEDVDEPAIDEPSTDEATIDEPAFDEAATGDAPVDEPAVDEPADDEQADDEAAADQQAAEEQADDEPATDNVRVDEVPVDEVPVEEPAVEEPTVEGPAVAEPAADEPAVAEQPAADVRGDDDVVRAVTDPSEPTTQTQLRPVASPPPRPEPVRTFRFEDPFASMPHITPFTDFALDPIEDEDEDEPERVSRHSAAPEPEDDTHAGRRRRSDDGGDDMLARILARERG